jgi:hypothetical protein
MAEWSGTGDQLDRTARQVRKGNAIHALDWAADDPWSGRVYWTTCGEALLKERGAVLTTEPSKCGPCDAIAKLGGESRG